MSTISLTPEVLLSRVRCYDRHCRRDTWHVVRFVPWYGPDACCLRCGRTWTADDYRYHAPLPGGKAANEKRESNRKRYRDAWRKANP